jgi:uncharacterized membrane protein HdeD (DUF308 family)
MSTTLQDVGRMAESQLKKLRWALGINGALSIALGAVIIVWPNISLYALVLVFGAFALARGIVGLATAFASPVREGRGWLVFWSLVSIAVGVIVFFNTGMSALALLYVIGAYAIVLGIVTIGGAFWLPLDGGDTALFTLTGLVSIVFGIVMFAEPGDGALVLLALIAAYALIVGVAEITVAVGGKRLARSFAKRYAMQPGEAQTSR